MKDCIRYCLRQHCSLIFMICLFATPLHSEVTLDGSTSPAQTLSGPDYQITENLGQRTGNNLFHSFGRFNIDKTESATFSGSPDIQNVISRVTGGQTSTIDGLLKSTIPNANLYFINPAGVFFGENARIDVQGSFHTSTADYLGFKDGVRFDSGDVTTKPVLTTAAPEAFGFLGNQSAGKITVSGGENSILEVKPGKTLSLIGGDININNSSLYAPGGQVNLVSVDSSGAATIGAHGIETASFTKMGEIHINRASDVPRATITSNENIRTIAEIDVSADKAGRMFIRSGQLILDNSFIVSDTKISDGGNIDIALTGDLILNEVLDKTSTSTTPVSEIRTFTSGTGDAGRITINANRIMLINGAHITSLTGKKSEGNSGSITLEARSVFLDNTQPDQTPLILTATQGVGDSEAILINSDQLDLNNSAKITTITTSEGHSGTISIPRGKLALRNGAQIITSVLESASGKAGDIIIQSDTVLLSGFSTASKLPSSITSLSSGSGNTGTLSISSPQLDILNGARINTFSNAEGNTGAIDIQSDRIFLSGVVTIESQDTNEQPKHVSAGIYSLTVNGDSGHVSVVSNKTLELKDAQISVATAGSGNTGNLLVKSDHIALNGTSDKTLTEISNRVTDVNENKSATGNSGSLTVIADSLVSKGALITTTNIGQGNSGPLVVKSKSILLTSGTENTLHPGGIISEFHRNSPNDPPRVSGGIFVKAENLNIESGTTISSTTFGSDTAGMTTISTDLLVVESGATIETSTFGSGSGGNLVITSGLISLAGKNTALKSISAKSDSGKVGNISISTEKLEISNQARIDSSTRGRSESGGSITINAQDIQLSGVDTKIVSSTEDKSRSDAGNISIVANDLKLKNGALIDVSTLSRGHGGNLTLDLDRLEIRNNSVISSSAFSSGNSGILKVTANSIILDGAGSNQFTGLSTQANEGTGNGGDLTIAHAGSLEIRNNAKISASTFTSGQAGNVVITADNILLSNAQIQSKSDTDNLATASDAMSGNISITANKRFQLKNAGEVSVSTKQAQAGNISINGEGILLLSNKSRIGTSVANGKGAGGSITINSPVLALDTSSILASAVEGNGGNITISGLVFESPGSRINASSQVKMDGLVNLKPDTTISGSLSVLSSAFIDNSKLLGERCAARSASGNSFITNESVKIAPVPGNLMPSNLLDFSTDQQIPPQSSSSYEQLHSALPADKNNAASTTVNEFQLVLKKTDCGKKNTHL